MIDRRGEEIPLQREVYNKLFTGYICPIYYDLFGNEETFIEESLPLKELRVRARQLPHRPVHVLDHRERASARPRIGRLGPKRARGEVTAPSSSRLLPRFEWGLFGGIGGAPRALLPRLDLEKYIVRDSS